MDYQKSTSPMHQLDKTTLEALNNICRKTVHSQKKNNTHHRSKTNTLLATLKIQFIYYTVYNSSSKSALGIRYFYIFLTVNRLYFP